jgi:hypothetical protein
MDEKATAVERTPAEGKQDPLEPGPTIESEHLDEIHTHRAEKIIMLRGDSTQDALVQVLDAQAIEAQGRREIDRLATLSEFEAQRHARELERLGAEDRKAAAAQERQMAVLREQDANAQAQHERDVALSQSRGEQQRLARDEAHRRWVERVRVLTPGVLRAFAIAAGVAIAFAGQTWPGIYLIGAAAGLGVLTGPKPEGGGKP